MYGAAAAAAAAAGGGDGGCDTAYPPPAHMGIQPLYVDSKTAGKSSSSQVDPILDHWPTTAAQTFAYAMYVESLFLCRQKSCHFEISSTKVTFIRTCCAVQSINFEGGLSNKTLPQGPRKERKFKSVKKYDNPLVW